MSIDKREKSKPADTATGALPSSRPPTSAVPGPQARTSSGNIDELMTQAESALRAGRWFEAERLAQKALSSARRIESWDAMARIVLPLQEARRLRLSKAFDTKRVAIVESPVHDADAVAPGCYLVQPPLVGADARRLRLAALRQEVFAAVICREPLSQLKLCPIVAIGAITIRARVQPPKNIKKPTLEWFIGAMEALGDAAIEALDSGLDLDRQIDHVLACIDSIPDHEKLHQLLGDMCRSASKGFERRLPPRLFADEDDDQIDAAPDAPAIKSDEDE